MKNFFKFSLLATTLTVGVNSTMVMAAETTAASGSSTAAAQAKAQAKEVVKLNSAFNNTDDQTAYALGASLGKYIANSLEQQKKLGISLDSKLLLTGVEDAYAGKSKLQEQEVAQTLQVLQSHLKEKAEEKMMKDAKENEAKGAAYQEKFVKESDVKKTKTGLLYKIEKQGTGASPKDSDTVVVNYKGSLVDGTEFDSSYKRGEPLTFRLDGVIPGWTEGLKHLKKGGKMTMVIPPALAYGEAGVPGIPASSTLVFEVELLDIKAPAKAVSKTVGKAASKAAASSK